MEKLDFKTDNELIAEFMGAIEKRSRGRGSVGTGFYKMPNQENTYTFFDGSIHWTSMKFSTSWDWLMPVVEKIGKLYEKAFPTNEEFIKLIKANKDPVDKEYIDVISTSIYTPISEVYEVVVKFIKWHNEQK